MKKTLAALKNKVNSQEEKKSFFFLKGGNTFLRIISTNENQCSNSGDCTTANNKLQCNNSGTCV